jgi:alkylhydroperoxidase family enzyme
MTKELQAVGGLLLGLAMTGQAPADEAPAVAPLDDAACWKALPETVSGGGGPLPIWARAVAVRLPRTAAAMLELDLAQRTRSPLDLKLRAAMRWVVARNNRCAYTEAYALADARRAGLDEATIKAVTGDPSGWPADYRDALEFARLHTVDAPSIPDALFAKLVAKYGEHQAAAMVLLGAYGNFQDRVVLGLNLPGESGPPLEPIAVKFTPGAFQSTPVLPPQSELKPLKDDGATVVDRDPEWSELSYDSLQSRLETQRARQPRLPIPTWDEVKKGLPPEFAQRPTRIVWNLVCSGYVPELALPWSRATRTMWAEAKPDRVFEESLFWVQTRAIRCNYCMGHCEMLLEVAGLDKGAIAERTRRLAGDDWSAFPPEEQRAYAYARKLTKAPWTVTPADYKALEADLGPDAAMATFWWLCRGLYMTRVSDGFALPLERENVFMDFYGPKGPQKK